MAAGSGLNLGYKTECLQAQNTGETVDAVIEYADNCQFRLNMDIWPVSTLCTDMANNPIFRSLLGDYCEPQCFFGTKNGGTTCICNNGFWNTTCDTECPGGATNPCSGYGSCDDQTGKCDCPLNKQGADDCSLCSDGWIGPDCQIAENKLNGNKSVALASQLGHMTNLDGLSFIVREPSVYTLMTVSDVLVIQGKYIICHQNYTCITFLSVRLGDSTHGYSTITIKAPKLDTNKPIVYLENQEKSVDETLYFHGFYFERLDIDELKITIADNVEILIRLQGQYLTMEFLLNFKYLELTSGLLCGSGEENSTLKFEQLLYREIYSPDVCTYSGTIQGSSPSPIVYTLNFNTVVLAKNTSLPSSLDFTRFAVAPCNEFIHYPSIHDKNQNVGGYSLNFASSIIYGDVDLYTSIGSNITFEFLTKLNNDTDKGGVLFSFSNRKLFIVQVYSDSVQIIYENQTYTTNLTLQYNEWNKVVVMYYGELGDFDIYVFNSEGNIKRRSYVLPLNIFSDPGTLSIGHWQPPFNGKVLIAPEAFSGLIDNFLVWKISLEPNIVTDIFQKDPLDIQHLLSSLWQFDEGQGSATSDYLQGTIINLPISPWVPPEWIPSDVYYVKNTYPKITYVYYESSTIQTQAESICHQIVNNTYTSCSNLSSATKQIFYTACLQIYSATLNLPSAYNVILSFGKICQTSQDLVASPTTMLCNSLTSIDKENSGCSKTCVYGEIIIDGSCSCAHGYYGSSCTKICPGGSDSPCNNHGTCNTAGLCECVWNWNGSVDCGTCTSGMKGLDCRVLYEGSSLGTKAYITGKADFMGFNGYQISLDTISGVYTVFDSPTNFAVEVYQVNCMFGSCIIGVSIKTSLTQIVIMPSGQDDMPPIVYQDTVKLDYGVTTVMSDMTMELKSYTDLEITVGTSTIKVTVQNQGIDVSLNVQSSVCSIATGIIGNCTGTSDTYETYNQNDLMHYIETTYVSVDGPIVQTLLTVFGQNVTLNSGFALAFNQTSSVSETLTYRDNDTMNSQSFSLSMYFKPTAEGGVLLAYSKNTTFSILNSNPVTMECGTKSISTTISPHIGEWNQIIITFDGTNNHIYFYHYGPNITISYEVINDFCPNLFLEGGKIALGEWIPSFESDKYTYTGSFVGEIEEASIWKDPILSSLIFQAESLNVKLSGFLNNVSSLWSFSEGVGYTAFDSVLGNDMSLPSSPWQSPVWVVSDKTLKVINDEVAININTQQEAVSFCTDFFTAVSSSCSGVSASTTFWFKNQCILLGSSTSNVSDSVTVMISFATVCGMNGGSTSTLFNSMCSLNTSVPFWVSQVCNNCGFGYLGSDGACICYYGFHGTNCDQFCPNGITLPCNDRGVCDTSGMCQCEGHWSGSACSSCATGWEGNECVVMETGQPANQSVLVAQISANGQMISFDGHLVDLTIKGVYLLFGHSDELVNVYGHMLTCYDTLRPHLCLRDIVIDVDGTFYYIRSKNSFQESKVVLYTDSAEINVYDKYTTSKMDISISQTNILSVTFINMELSVKIIYVDNGLIMTISYSNNKWISEATLIDGILTSCETKSAIQLAACNSSRTNICTNSVNTTSEGSCVGQLTFLTVELFMSSYVFTDNIVDEKLERQYIITGPACLQFSGSGIYVSEVEMPTTVFTVEFHVKPTAVNGPMLTYHTKSHQTIVVNYKTGIVIIADEIVYQTNILIELNVWNQINLVWKPSGYKLEVYVISGSGTTTVKEISCSFNIFETGGTLTVGQIGDGVTSLFPIGTFNGYIDELRIWTRPHSPSIVRNNWRISVTDKTPNLHAVWSLNEGTGYVASDLKNSQHMYMVNYDNTPTWAASDLDLSPGVDLKLPELTALTPLNTAIDTTRCDDLLKSSELTTNCAGLENILSSLYDQCVILVQTTGNPDMAEVILLSFSDYCKEAKNLTDSPIKSMCNLVDVYEQYVSWYGGSCSNECIFGFVNNSICSCDSSHYGLSCSGVCGLGPMGACNSHGTCDSSSGQCACHAHWYGQSVSVSQYWRSFSALFTATISVSSYSCVDCSLGWYGTDCNFVVQNIEGRQSYAAGLIFASYITTLGGASYRIILPGIYNVYSVSGLSVQAVFWPCNSDIFCRQIKEISINSGGQTVSVMRYNDTLQPMHVGGSTTFEFATTTTVAGINIKWIVREYIRITVGSFTVLVADSNIGLICRFKVGKDSGRTSTGLLGNADNTWWMDLVSPTDQSGVNSSFIDQSLSASYTGSWTKKEFGTSLISVHTWHTDRQQNLSTSGYLLHLTLQTATYTNIHMTKDITTFTISFWIRIQVHLRNQVLIVYQMDGQNLTLSAENGYLGIQWGNTWTSTLEMKVGSWIYTAITWKSVDGEFLIYMMTDGGLQYKAIRNVHVASVLNIEGMFLFGNNDSPLEIDHARIWKVSKSLDTILSGMSVYVDDITSDNELLSVIGFDEGTGLISNMATPTSSSTTQLPGKITEPESDDLWLPSDIPTAKSYLPKDTAPSNVNASVLNDCIAALNNSDLQQYCNDVSNITEFFLEACLMDYTNVGENATYILLIHNLIFYCQTTFNVDECKLKDYFDYCTTDTETESKDDIMLIIIIAICCIIPIIILLLCCCCWWQGLLCFKKKQPVTDSHKEKIVKEDCEEDVDEDMAYSRSRITSRTGNFLFEDNEGFGRLDSRAGSAISASDFPILFEAIEEENMASPAPPRGTLFAPAPALSKPSHSGGPRTKSSLLATLSSIIPQVRSRPKGDHPSPADIQIQDTNMDDEGNQNVSLPNPMTFSRHTNATPVFGKKSPSVFTKQSSATPVFGKSQSNGQSKQELDDNGRPVSASSVGSRAKSHSPFVIPGNNDGDRKEETASPFQPEDAHSYSVMNRGYSPEVGEMEPVFSKSHHEPLPVLTEVPSMETFKPENIGKKKSQKKGRKSRAADAIHAPVGTTTGNDYSGKHSANIGTVAPMLPKSLPMASKIPSLETFKPNTAGKKVTGTKGRASSASDALHAPDGTLFEKVEEVIIRPPSYKAPSSPGLLIDLDDAFD